MYSSIMVPVDLEHAANLEKALDAAADLARHYGAKLSIAGVTGVTPGAVAHSPAEYAEKLEKFAAEQGERHGVAIAAKAVTSVDPAVDLEERLKEAADDVGADLVVMASHVPGFMEHLFASHAGYLASHTGLSVFIVR